MSNLASKKVVFRGAHDILYMSPQPMFPTKNYFFIGIMKTVFLIKVVGIQMLMFLALASSCQVDPVVCPEFKQDP